MLHDALAPQIRPSTHTKNSLLITKNILHHFQSLQALPLLVRHDAPHIPNNIPPVFFTSQPGHRFYEFATSRCQLISIII
jgi:hypothetical protein